MQRKIKSTVPIPIDAEKGFPLLEIQQFDKYLEELILAEETLARLERIIREFKKADVLAKYNLQHKKKVLFCGKPGTGKTFSAQIISSVLKIPLVNVSFDSVISSYLGETAGNLRKVFDFIENGTWIVLFDEFDMIGKNRDDSHEHGVIKRVVNNFLRMLDKLTGNSLILVATNHQNILDSARWRRFDDVIYFELPAEKARQKLFEINLKPLKRESDIDILKFVGKTEGFSPADIKMVTVEAMITAIIDSRKGLSMNDLENAVNRFICREKVKNGEQK